MIRKASYRCRGKAAAARPAGLQPGGKTKYPISPLPHFRRNYDTILWGCGGAAWPQPDWNLGTAAISLRNIKYTLIVRLVFSQDLFKQRPEHVPSTAVTCTDVRFTFQYTRTTIMVHNHLQSSQLGNCLKWKVRTQRILWKRREN